MNAVTFMGFDLISGLNITMIAIVPKLFPNCSHESLKYLTEIKSVLI